MLLRRSIAGSGAALMLSAGLVAGAPPATAHDHWKPWGATRAPDQVLRAGCHGYRYHYRVSPPTDSWAAEFFLVNPNGRKIASEAIASESDPDRAWLKWTICRPSTVYGRHKIKMKVTYIDPEDPTPDSVSGWVKPSTFRLTRP
jgi:hypothetical protein